MGRDGKKRIEGGGEKGKGDGKNEQGRERAKVGRSGP